MEERKSNKKARNIIIIAMLVLLLAILCLCGTTFARYITQTSVPTQQATVAKWGFVVNVNADNLFSGKYNAGVAVTTDDTVDVKASTDGQNVVAPGTSGKITFSVSGSAEVLAKITIAMDADTVKDVELKTTGVTYNPVKWTLRSSADGTNYTDVTGATDLTLAAMVEKVNDLQTANIAPGTTVNAYYELAWAWEFENETEATAAVYNKYDTILGYAAQGAGTYENGLYVVAVSGDTITVTEKAEGGDIAYTAEITTALGLSVGVAQVQNAAPETPVEP